MAQIQLIRSATLKIFYAGNTILVDPMLGNKGSFESYGEIAENPITNLPFTKEEVLENIDFVLVSHLHKDHFDDAAKKLISKSLPVFCQPGDKENIESSGFKNVSEIKNSLNFNSITVHRTLGKHGRGSVEKLMGQVSGFVFQSENEPTIYIIGDSIFNEDVKKAINVHKPQIIITNSGGAFIPGHEDNLILLDEKETLELAEYANESKIITVHLEALDHCSVNRASLKLALLQSNISQKNFFIPNDGEVLEFHK